MTHPSRTVRLPHYLVCFSLAGALLLGGCDLFKPGGDGDPEPDPWEHELDEARAAVEVFKDFAVAQAAGYTVRATEHWTGMGVHYLNPDLLDDTFEHTKPEVLMYLEHEDGSMEFVGVEYGVPVDLEHPAPPPEGYTGDADTWAINEQFSLWTLHAWLVLDNPDGIFAPRNPRIP